MEYTKSSSRLFWLRLCNVLLWEWGRKLAKNTFKDRRFKWFIFSAGPSRALFGEIWILKVKSVRVLFFPAPGPKIERVRSFFSKCQNISVLKVAWSVAKTKRENFKLSSVSNSWPWRDNFTVRQQLSYPPIGSWSFCGLEKSLWSMNINYNNEHLKYQTFQNCGWEILMIGRPSQLCYVSFVCWDRWDRVNELAMRANNNSEETGESFQVSSFSFYLFIFIITTVIFSFFFNTARYNFRSCASFHYSCIFNAWNRLH